jgi:hypothetical protein
MKTSKDIAAPPPPAELPPALLRLSLHLDLHPSCADGWSQCAALKRRLSAAGDRRAG